MDEDTQYKRLVQKAAVVFLLHGDDCLMLHRSITKEIDPGLMNGVGGKVDPGEDFLTCALREVEEETGYVLQPEEMHFTGLVRIDGLPKDWLVTSFVARVDSKEIPHGQFTDDGELIWVPVAEMLSGKYPIVAGTWFTFKDIMTKPGVFFSHLHCEGLNNVVKSSIQRVAI